MQDAIGNQDVRGEELSRVDVDIVPGVENGDVLSVLGEEFGSVREAGRVDDLGDDGVVHDLGKLLRGHVRDSGTKGLECLIRSSEDCNVCLVGDAVHDIGCVERAFEGGKVEGRSGVGEIGRWDQEGVNHLDHAAGEFQVLQ